MQNITRFLLDSGDPKEYKEAQQLLKDTGNELWGATTNPSLIAKKLGGKKITQEEALLLQKNIVLEIIDLLPGAVSAEVYANKNTTADAMIEQGRDIASWHKRVVVKLPTTIEGFKARTILRKNHIPVNNTLVFSQEQIFAICLHEEIMQKNYGPINEMWPPFISPFVGRLDDQGKDGMQLVEHGMKIKREFAVWMLEASVRTVQHIKRGIQTKTELITAPLNIYKEWTSLSKKQQDTLGVNDSQNLSPIPYWKPTQELLSITTEETFTRSLTSKRLDIGHPLTEKGIEMFTTDWQSIIIAS